MRAFTATWLCGLAPMRAGIAAAATAATTTTADTQFANYALATELGPGIYAISGRTITVYQLQPGYSLRERLPNDCFTRLRLVIGEPF
jgi:hypothetical protein